MVPASERTTENRRIEERRRYNDRINASIGIGFAGFVGATVAWILTDEPLVLYAGLAVYWLGCLGMGIAYWRSPVSLNDELERRIEREASQTTLTFVAVVTIIGVPADVVLSSTGVYTAPPAIRGAIWGYLLVILVFVAAHWLQNRQYE